MNKISLILVPFLVFSIVIYGFKKKVPLYDAFIRGAKEGLITTFDIAPYIMGMVFAINIFLESNFVPSILSFLKPLLAQVNLPIDVLPMAIFRPLSGTASLVILNDIFASFGPDSFVGRLASTIQGCSDTTFYVLALYFGSVRITKTRYALKAGLMADFVGIVMSFVIVYLFFG